MRNVRVNQKPGIVPERPGANENRNWFDGLSHPWVASLTMGKLVPFLKIPTLPNDFFRINAEVMMRFAPMYLPVMSRINLSLDYFYVPNRIIWHDSEDANDSWEDFIMNKQDSLTVPKVVYTAFDYTYGSASELPMYMGAPTVIEDEVGLTLTININAMPLAAYYMIYDQYYRNDQLQSPIQAQDDLQSAFPTTFQNEPAASLSCAYRNWNRDLFTSCTAEPQQGAPVQIPLVDLDFETAGGYNPGGPFRWRKTADGLPSGGTDLIVNNTITGEDGSTAAITTNAGLYLDIQETAADIAAFRFASVYQEFLERAMRAGDRISDYYEQFWHTDPYKGTLQLPLFIGGKKGNVIVSEVMSTTETTTLKVGNYAGQALALESTNEEIQYHCLEHGYIIGIVSVYPDSGYFQGLERDWTRTTYLDYPDPRFALIGDEEVLNQEVQYTFQTDILSRNTETFGYRERLLDARFKNGTVAGLMRTILNSFHLQRLLNPTNPESLTDGSVLNSAFLQCKPRITDVFQVVEGEDEIYAHIFNDIKVQRLLPKFGIPQL